MRAVIFPVMLLWSSFVGAAGQMGADYPPEALRHHWEGDVIADLTISAEGRVTGCKIAQTSGHQVLDDATCEIVMKRARFKPALDANGKPTEDHFRTPPFRWRINDH